MLGPSNETVGEPFRVELLQAARDKTLDVINKMASLIKPGMTEVDTKELLKTIQTQMGAPRSWHPPQIRFGENSTLPFNQNGLENPALKDNDIYFLDIGPIFDDHEGDVGRTFVVGNDLEMKKCSEDVERIWHEVRTHWQEQRVTGPALYAFARRRAEAYGWELSLQKANGHRISDFPHAIRIRGSIEGWEEVPAPNRWILEIQIRHPTKPFGAFFEDLLA